MGESQLVGANGSAARHSAEGAGQCEARSKRNRVVEIKGCRSFDPHQRYFAEHHGSRTADRATGKVSGSYTSIGNAGKTGLADSILARTVAQRVLSANSTARALSRLGGSAALEWLL